MRFADEEVLYKHLKVKKGSVTPLALMNSIQYFFLFTFYILFISTKFSLILVDSEKDVKFIIDKNAVESDYLLVHPMQNHATISLMFSSFYILYFIFVLFRLIYRSYV